MEVDFSMACAAKCDEVFFRITSQKASRLHVMDLEIFGTSASLTSPAITSEHVLAEAPIGISVQTKPGLSWDWWIHEAFGIRNRNS
jgi:hypothetical protein